MAYFNFWIYNCVIMTKEQKNLITGIRSAEETLYYIEERIRSLKLSENDYIKMNIQLNESVLNLLKSIRGYEKQ